MRQTMFLFLILIVPGVTCGEDEIQTTELKVVPQALSDSLGTDTFLFRDYDLTDSDAAILITTACAGMRDNLQNHFFDLTKQYLEIPFTDFDAEKASEEVSNWLSNALRDAARCRRALWSERTIDNDLVLQMMGKCKVLLRINAVHCRADIKRGDYHKAQEKIRTGLSVVRHLQTLPIGVVQSISASSIKLYLDLIEELISNDSEHNYYWALSGLPSPLDEMRRTIDREIHLIPISTGVTIESLQRIKPAENWRKLRNSLETGFRFQGGFGFTIEGDNRKFKGKSRLPEIAVMRDRLLKSKLFPDSDLENMPEDELCVKFFAELYVEKVETIAKSVHLEPHHAIARMERDLERELETKNNLLREFLPAMAYYLSRSMEVTRRVDLLRTTELIRAYVADHEHQPPQSIDELDPELVPRDIFTGNAFELKTEKDEVLLSAPAMKKQRIKKQVFRIQVVTGGK